MLGVALRTGALVGLAEMGDKTQLLTLALFARYRRPLPVLAGLAAGTLASSLLAVAAGGWVAAHVPETALRWALGLGFMAVAAWMLVPESKETPKDRARASGNAWGVFFWTALTLVLADMGDKTQVVTAGLAVRYPGQEAWVWLGSVCGTFLADGLAVAFGGGLVAWAGGRRVRLAVAAVFALWGLWILAQAH